MKTLRIVVSTLAIGLQACGTSGPKQEVVNQTAAMQKAGAQQAPAKNVTFFSGGLRCMDGLLLQQGLKGIPVLVEDIADSTKKVNAGAKDMLISALSDMTRRSDAIRLIAYGADASNLTNMMAAGMLNPGSNVLIFSLKPAYAIRGSISQLDENLVRERTQGGVQIGWFGAGGAVSASSSLIGLDLNVISAADFTAVSGVSASNSLVILKEGAGFDADVLYKKFGVNFEMNLERSEGQAQALRTLVQLAAIELVGKLTKTPYWRCLGLDLSNPEIAQEARDWHYNLVRRGEIGAFVQRQLRVRGWYAGPLTGRLSQEFDDALAQASVALGVPHATVADEKLFFALLASDATAPNRVAGALDDGVSVRIVSATDTRQFARGQNVQLTVEVDRPAYVYCYMQDEAGRLVRIYPNRHSNGARVEPTRPLQIPGGMPFSIRASDAGRKEAIACFATPREISGNLAPQVWGVDLETLAARSIKDVQQAFAAVAGESVGSDAFLIDVR